MSTKRAKAASPGHVLVHSPVTGPATWQPVAALLPSAVVPSLLDAVTGPQPTWPALVREVVESAEQLPGEIVLTLHSNAGLFAPAMADALGGRLRGVVLVDAPLPEGPGTGHGELLRQLVDADGMLPPWTRWFDPRVVATMLPDPDVRRRIEAEQPRLPLAHFLQQPPMPPSWHRVPLAYLRFSEAYVAQAALAHERGAIVERLPGEHLHQVVDPEAVAARLTALAESL